MIEGAGNNKDIAQEIKDRFRFLIELAIFFSAIIYYFYIIFNKAQAEEMVLNFSTLVPFYLLDYLLFEALKNYMTSRWLKGLNILVLIAMWLFLIPSIHICLIKNSFQTFNEFISFAISLNGMLILPIIILLIILSAPIVYWDSNKNKRRKFLGFEF